MSGKLKVSQNFTIALDRLAKGYNYYHSASDRLALGPDNSKAIIHPNDSAPTFRLTLSEDKKTLTIWYQEYHWGSKNRATLATQKFGVQLYNNDAYKFVDNGHRYTFVSKEGFLKDNSTATAAQLEKAAAGETLKKVSVSFSVHHNEAAPQITTSADEIEKKTKKPTAKSFEELWKLTNENILAQTSEFYLLAAASLEDNQYEPQWKEYARDFAELLKNYLAMACGGELRHSRHHNDWLESFRSIDKAETWRAWYDVYTIDPLANIEKAAEEFYRLGAWSNGFGGPAWGKAANYLAEFIKGKYSPVMFVDLVIDLEHNTGCIFNKWFIDTGILKGLLNAKFNGKDNDYELLLKYAEKQDIKIAYINTLRSGKKQRILAHKFVSNMKQIHFKNYKECTKCGSELEANEKVCKKCITCPMCHQVVSLPMPDYQTEYEGPKMFIKAVLPAAVYHQCLPVKIEIPSVNHVRS